MRYSTEFYQQLRAIAESVDKFAYVKVRTDNGYVYFAIERRVAPDGRQRYYEEVYPDLSPSAPIGTTPLMVTDWPKVRHLAQYPNQRHGAIRTLCNKVGFPARGPVTPEGLAALPLCAACRRKFER